MVMFHYSICVMHFSIMKSELIWGDFCRNSLFFSDKLIILNSVRRQTSLLANKKDIVRFELTLLHEVSVNARVNMKPHISIIFNLFCSSPFLSSRSNTCLSFFQ